MHADAMLRHLGAAYYESLHGRATRADVTRALETVEEHLNEQPEHPHPVRKPRTAGGHDRLRHPRGWSREVGDVMTTSVITVDRITPYKEIARLMTTPAITVGPHVTIPAAARLMNTHRIRRLPVVDDKGRLIGIVSRRDLLSVFLRPDEDIRSDIRQVLDEILAAEPGEADVTVRNGIVTLTGTLDPQAGQYGDLIPLAIRLMWGIDGVVDIVDHLGEPQAAAMRKVQVTSGEQ
jgi:hypothetical protein